MSTQEQATIAKGMAIGWFTLSGYSVSIPISRHLEYDLLVDKQKIERVRIISTSHRNPAGNYEVALRQISANYYGKSETKEFENSGSDLLFIVCNSKSSCDPKRLFLIPSVEITQKIKFIIGEPHSGFEVFF